MNKLIIVSKLFLFYENNELITQNLQFVDNMASKGIQIGIIAKSSTNAQLLRNLPTEYKDKVKFIGRGEGGKQEINRLKDNGILIALVGVVDQDAIFAFNCKLPLFNPEYIVNRIIVLDKVRRYGLPFGNFDDVANCLQAFQNYKQYYFGLSSLDNYTVFSLINANTFYRPEVEVRIKEIFQVNLKAYEGTRDQKILMILLFMLMAEVTRNPLYETIDYWGTFPSSKTDNLNTSASFIKESVRVILGGGPRGGHEIFLRHSDMVSKHQSGKNRLTNKCNRDFDTLIINPKIAHLIKGKSVCIIDDYITNGYSAETARHLLLSHGVKNVIVLSIGKFGTNYYSTNYELGGDLTKPNYPYRFINEILNGTHNSSYQSFYTDNNSDLLDYENLI